jgi:hypothetical protein
MISFTRSSTGFAMPSLLTASDSGFAQTYIPPLTWIVWPVM